MRFRIEAAALALLCAATAATAQTYQPPRTPDGRPDLQGGWGEGFFTPFQRPPGVKELVVDAGGAKAMAKEALQHIPKVVDPDANFALDFQLAVVRGEARTSILVAPEDGRLPLTPEGKALVEQVERQWRYGYDDPEQRDATERCLAGGGQAPVRAQNGYTPMQIVQTPAAIVMMTEDAGGLRIIDMTGHAPPPVMVSLEGYSAGHWEGDTLVVETTRTRSDDLYRTTPDTTVLVGPNSKVIERFTRLSDTELLEQFTVEDPEYYSKPWLGEFSLTRTAKPAYEYACHEANYAESNILKAARLGRQNAPPPKKKS